MKKITINELRTLVREYLYEDIDTEFTESRPSSDVIRRKFFTNSGNGYVVEFIYKILNGGNNVNVDGNIIDINNIISKDKYPILYCFDIGYSTIENVDSEDGKIYGGNTNRNESAEVIGRLTNIVKKFIDSNPKIKIYIVGEPDNVTNEGREFNDDQIRTEIYKKIFRNTFALNFKMFIGTSSEYETPTMFYINKTILK